MRFTDVLEKINKLKVSDNLEQDIKECFVGYSYSEKTEVIVSADDSNSNIDLQAYIDHPNAPIACIKLNGNEVIAW